MQKRKRISIQGYEGSFHQIAAREFFGDTVTVLPCATFTEVVRTAADPATTSGGIMAIENSIAGSILPNYTLLQKSSLQISGEIYLQIHQHLLSNPGVKLSDVKEVQSHPMALLQCMDYLEQHSWKLIESEDTAESARYIHQHRNRHTAAIASRLAAELYGLQILKESIQSNHDNYTRFLFVEPYSQDQKPALSDKASINFHTDHAKGSLVKVLQKIADGGINLSKLQSFPIPDKPWQYNFYADMEFDNVEQLERVLSGIRESTASLRVFGIYKKGKTVMS